MVCFVSSMLFEVISSRIIRDLVVAKDNALKLKQVFVRHVSHEIRYALQHLLPYVDSVYFIIRLFPDRR